MSIDREFRIRFSGDATPLNEAWGSAAWPSIGSDLTPMVGTIPAQLQFDAMGIATVVLGGPGTGGRGHVWKLDAINL
jgi:hypothetical protein